LFIVTLIADTLSSGDTAHAADRLRTAGCTPGQGRWIDEGRAFDLPFDGDPAAARRAIEGAIARTDAVVQREAGREKALIISDMDSTMITVECIDELADYAGLREEISAVTERAMQGELDFDAALDARVALLKGMDVGILDTCYRERVRIMPGAEALVRTMRSRGGFAVLVSGGFTHFAEPVAAEIGFDRSVSNVLGVADGRLDGTVLRPIVGAETKRETLLAAMAERNIATERTLAVGDGANDIPMIQAAGLGVAYHAKEKAAAAADARVLHGDLTVLLYAQGIARRDWVN
jgi:phosphoserine phosphatase